MKAGYYVPATGLFGQTALPSPTYNSKCRVFQMLQKYTLRAFNEIPDVTSAEIAMKLNV